MSGRRSVAFHEGDRSEYLATFALSSFATVTPVPRQEDYGFDLICSLTRREEDGSLYVEKGFGVQVKSFGIREVSLGGMTKGSKRRAPEWKRWETKWLFHQDNPLFIALVSKNEWRVKLYSTTRMWGAQWLSGGPHRISLVPKNKEYFDSPPADHRFSQTVGPDDGTHGNGVWKVALGKPILDITPKQLEDKEFRHLAFSCMSDWIEIDRRNLVHHALGIPFTIEPHAWGTNERPSQVGVGGTYQNSTPGMNIGRILSSIVPAIVSLKANFQAQQATQELAEVESALKLLRDNYSQLDPVSRSIVDTFANWA